jgi:5-methyltetrahydrofolate--homocysteine methyltransferase
MVHPFLQALRSGRVLLMDGAMGTELQRAGVQQGACYEQWNLTHAETVHAIHGAYVEAGAEVVLTNTFQANPVALGRHQLEGHLHEICAAGVELAQSAGKQETFVVADCTSFEVPSEEVPARLLAAWQHADALLVETCSDVVATLVLVGALQKAMCEPRRCWLPIVLSFTYHLNAAGELRTFHDFTPEAVARQASGLAVAALGVNCGRDISIDDCAEILRRYRSVTDLRLFARPNAGTPKWEDGQWVYPHTPEQMAAQLPVLLAAGATMVGGCCGTTPAHIRAFRKVVDGWNTAC